MADVTIDPKNKNPKELVTQGICAYHIQDYPSAVQALSLASELLAAEHGDKHDSLGDVYYFYGKALLELSREEAEPLGDAVTKTIEDDSDSDEADTEEPASAAATVEEKPEEAKADKGEAVENGEAGPSSGQKKIEGDSTEDGDEDPSDLQVAWEVLELAKIIFENRGESGRRSLADTLVVLGEVSLESENFEAAIADIKRGLEILLELKEPNKRLLAETHYKLGIALSTNADMDEAVEQFNASLDLLKARITELEEEKKHENETEIKQMKELIPEIEEKIADTKNFKEEAYRSLAANIVQENATTTFKGDSSAPAQAKDISHLVKRKRKLEDIVQAKGEEEEVPAKRPST